MNESSHIALSVLDRMDKYALPPLNFAENSSKRMRFRLSDSDQVWHESYQNQVFLKNFLPCRKVRSSERVKQAFKKN